MSHLRNIIIGTIVGTILTEKVVKSAPIRNLVVNTMAKGIKLQKDAAYTYETMKEEAEDLYEENERLKNPKEEIEG